MRAVPPELRDEGPEPTQRGHSRRTCGRPLAALAALRDPHRARRGTHASSVGPRGAFLEVAPPLRPLPPLSGPRGAVPSRNAAAEAGRKRPRSRSPSPRRPEGGPFPETRRRDSAAAGSAAQKRERYAAPRCGPERPPRVTFPPPPRAAAAPDGCSLLAPRRHRHPPPRPRAARAWRSAPGSPERHGGTEQRNARSARGAGKRAEGSAPAARCCPPPAPPAPAAYHFTTGALTNFTARRRRCRYHHHHPLPRRRAAARPAPPISGRAAGRGTRSSDLRARGPAGSATAGAGTTTPVVHRARSCRHRERTAPSRASRRARTTSPMRPCA